MEFVTWSKIKNVPIKNQVFFPKNDLRPIPPHIPFDVLHIAYFI
jgi:hypothetical protein